MEDFVINLEKAFLKANIELSEDQKNKFFEYFKLLKYWNERINLTSIIEEKDVIEKHFLDSVLSCQIIPQDVNVIDLGSGAGFPGIPLKIIRKDLNIALVDSVNKKVNFLNTVIESLNLDKIKAIHSRIEDFANQKNIRENFDVVVSRAVSRLNVLCEYSLPFLKIGGILVAYKSIDTDEEITEAQKAIKILGGSIDKVVDVSFDGMNRKLILIKKVSKTDKKYPRGANKPRLSPII